MGPLVLRPDGTVVAFGATPNQIAHTAIFNAYSNSWAAGPALPTINEQNYDMADAPAALLPSGNILFAASPGVYQTPTHFFELGFSDNSITQVEDPPYASSMSSYYPLMLVLPTGQILMNSRVGDIELYTGAGGPASAWAPVIANVPSMLAAGTSYQISGQQFNGLSQGAYYGDDYQSATNYPIVRITNNATGHVFFARSYGFNAMSVAPNTASTSNFTVPPGIETGASSLVVIANGIASQPASVTVYTPQIYSLSVSVIGSPGGRVTSSPSGIDCGSTCSANFNAGTQVTLTATPAPAWGLAGWGGGCGGIGGCSVTLNANTSVSAGFTTLFTAADVPGIGSPTDTPALPPAVIAPVPQ
jgi:hypothetical protein